ncbi:unnamed protein product, partial [Pelagomonas calceolata]
EGERRRPASLLRARAPARLVVARPLLGVVTPGGVEALLRGRRRRARVSTTRRSREAVFLRVLASDVCVHAVGVVVAHREALVVAARIVIVRVALAPGQRRAVREHHVLELLRRRAPALGPDHRLVDREARVRAGLGGPGRVLIWAERLQRAGAARRLRRVRRPRSPARPCPSCCRRRSLWPSWRR